jgi:hypothetical protein
MQKMKHKGKGTIVYADTEETQYQRIKRLLEEYDEE